MSQKIALINCIGKEEEYPPFYTRFQSIARNQFHVQVDLLKNGELCYVLTEQGEKVLLNGKPLDIEAYNLVFSRFAINSPHSGDYYVLRAFEQKGIPVVNPIASMIKAKDKINTLHTLIHAGLPITPTAVIRNKEEIEYAIAQVDGPPYIIKNCFGSRGKGVLLAYDKTQLESFFDYIWRINRNEILLIQPFLKVQPIHEDIRVICFGHREYYAMKRVASKDDFRTNIEIGGCGEIVEITPEEQEICFRASMALDMPFCGVDFIRTEKGPMILELNSCPGLSGISEVYQNYDIDILCKLVEFFCYYQPERLRTA